VTDERTQLADLFDRTRLADFFRRAQPANPFRRTPPANPFRRTPPAGPFDPTRPTSPLFGHTQPAGAFDRAPLASPANRRQLVRLFRRLGVERGGILMVHASLGGAGLRDTDVRDALLDVLGPDGTLVVPTFTPENSFTSRAYKALTDGMSEEQEKEFRASVAPFDPGMTACPTMGVLAECVWTTRGAVRSGHPHTSLAGLGPRAEELLAEHDPHCHLGERSPLAKLYAEGAQVLLFRVGFEACSAFHLAEYRMRPTPPQRAYHCVVDEKGNWTSYQDIELYDGDFEAIGALLRRDLVKEREMAGKAVLLFGMREAVDQAGDQMSGYRHGLT